MKKETLIIAILITILFISASLYASTITYVFGGEDGFLNGFLPGDRIDLKLDVPSNWSKEDTIFDEFIKWKGGIDHYYWYLDYELPEDITITNASIQTVHVGVGHPAQSGPAKMYFDDTYVGSLTSIYEDWRDITIRSDTFNLSKDTISRLDGLDKIMISSIWGFNLAVDYFKLSIDYDEGIIEDPAPVCPPSVPEPLSIILLMSGILTIFGYKKLR